ncbi:hypothetical protein BATDEDRAFT_89188 [Batrachochytrium dendrobatidis JAM81]|uniref:Major facilitator superfamily (MFS) profile domain-containing protein n=3 Tax=Batrachochytrium dendrobatidis TaxID=109871 RepID=F4P4Y8_BATDJ|nr:uncharacterized protein BATDEDRAFT_89188 [Batrachochytrium dendrobatidis JAM81]EGF79781.1 hypothetical protein BATDEDRAFT_89188 [Batrachochytrium dendrobatidis JAM81]OAJ38990.1 hypothetical protein BDEG_22876 [Batrachochytrium dendrobatidis JEL423]|eukprot:XP_006679675.1 hypothetical protein BATDEDRAFT_89188 [Batrachochytrium dendrobatidis JAM81]
MDYIKNHFKAVRYERSPALLKAEEYLFLVPPIKFNRYFLFPAALLIQLSIGSLYAWSGYNLPMEAYIYGLNGAIDRNIASNVFYVAVGVFGITAALLGPWLERRGPMIGCLFGAVMFYIGNLLAGLGVYTKHIELVFVGYGIIGGIGLGIAYIAPVSPLQKWFPEARGIAAGVAVCGFGGGSIIAPYAQKFLIGVNYQKTYQVGIVGIPLTFVLLGSIYFVLMVVSAVVLRMPPPGYSVKGITIDTIKGAEEFERKPMVIQINPHSELANKNALEQTTMINADQQDAITVEKTSGSLTNNIFSLSLSESLGSSEYWLTWFMFLGAQITGLLVISKIQSICQNQFKRSADVAILINSLLGGCNLLGRLLLPLFSDLLPHITGGVAGRKSIFLVSLIVQAVCLGFLPTVITAHDFNGFMVCAFVITFFYGGGFGIIPAFLADQFGAKNVGATHGIILLAWSTGSVVGGLIFTAVLKQETALFFPDIVSIYTLNFRWILGVVLVGLVLCFFIHTNLKDRRLPKVAGEFTRMRFVNGRMVRVYKNGSIKMISKEQEQEEWAGYLHTIGH